MPMDFARSRDCLKAFTVLISGRGLPARTPTASGTLARSTSEPITILPSATSSASPSLDMMTHVGGQTAPKLSADCSGSIALRGSPLRGDCNAGASLELGQKFQIGG